MKGKKRKIICFKVKKIIFYAIKEKRNLTYFKHVRFQNLYFTA